jgi:hypothetical protein
MYGWMLTRDRINNRYGNLVGPHGITKAHKQELLLKGGAPFRLLDDSGEVYYEGIIVGDYSGFEPLDDFGGPNDGCTDIQYPNEFDGSWESL